MASLTWHQRWSVLAFTVLSQALILGIHSYAFAFWILPWLNEFKVPRSQLMLIITASVAGVAIASPFVGIALDRFSMRNLYCTGALSFAVTLILISRAHSHWMIMLLYGVMLPCGIITCGTFGCQFLVVRLFSEYRGLALGIMAQGVPVGTFIAPLLVTSLLPSYGWRATFKMLALGTCLLLIPTALIVMRNLPQLEGSNSKNRVRPAEANAVRLPTRSLLASRDFWIISLGFGGLLGAYLPILYNMGSFASDLGIPQRRAALIASTGAITISIGKLTFGRLSDVVERHRLFQVAAGFMLVGVSVVSASSSARPLFVGILLSTFAIGSFVPLMSNMVADRFGTEAFGRVMGLVYLFVQVSALFPFLAALIRDSLGSYRPAFLAMLIPLIPAIITMQWLSRGRRAAPVSA